ncbi:hypothetical protein ACIBCM_10415 [Streptomyces sp. NPDC051018]|uniref:hypothetical protein n=1 Tax=Streptomyces sp. NPDC051018 TaxID=3365639 RepID=UPI003797366D
MSSAQPPSFRAIMNQLSDTWFHTPWSASEVSFDEGVYRGVFDIGAAAGMDTRTSYRPVLHAPVLAAIVSYQALASLLFAYTNGHHPTLAALPRVDMDEARRRIQVTSLRFSLSRPVFESRVPLRLTFDRITDRWDSHRMAFLGGTVDVADGKHTAKLQGCFNFRDAVDA